jgi:hypothetical protein
MSFLAFLLVGCSNDDIDYTALQKNIDKMQNYMENFGGDANELKKDVDSFNKQLKAIDSSDKNIQQFVDYQLKANNLRIEGINEDSPTKITKSAKYQYLAQDLLNKINK